MNQEPTAVFCNSLFYIEHHDNVALLLATPFFLHRLLHYTVHIQLVIYALKHIFQMF